MRLLKVSALMISSLLFWAGSSAQVESSTAWATASATIVKAAAVEEEPQTAVSEIVRLPVKITRPSKAGSGRVQLSPSPGSISVTAAAFRVIVEEHFTYAVLLPQEVNFNRCTSSTDDNLSLKNLSCIPSNGAAPAGGTHSFKINAHLNLDLARQPGTYQQESPFEINIVYN